MDIEFDFSDLDAKAERLQRDLADASRLGVLAAVRSGERAAEANAPRRTGQLANKIEGKVTSTSATQTKGTIVSPADYSTHVEYGTKPHDIVARRAKALRFQSGGSTVFRQAVHHPGTKAQPFMTFAEASAEHTLDEATNEGVDRAASKFNG